MTVSVKHSTPADGSFSTSGATAWNADHTLTGVGTMAEQNANNVAITGGSAALTTGTVSTTPSATTDIVNKAYADSIVKTYTAGTGLTLTTNQFSITNVGTAGTYGSSTQIPVLTTNAQGQITSITNTSIASGSGTVTSVGGTGTVSGITLTGTVTTTGNLTLGGTLDLSSPPAIGGTTPAAGTHTTLNLTGTTDQISSVAVSSVPSAPSAGNLKTFARTIAGGYTAPAFLNATQSAVVLQPAFANKRISILTNGPGSGVVNTSMGSFTGTATGVSPATTSMFTRAFRSTVVSTGTAGTFGNYYQGTAGYTLGSATTPAYGGFYYVIRFGIGDTVAAPRTFVGISSTTGAPTNVEPSTLTNSIGVGQGAADTNLKLYYGGSAAQTPIDLGINFPTNTSNTDWYELTLFAPPTSNNTVYYQVVRLNTGNIASGTLTGTAGTVLPSNTTFLALRNWRTNNATAAIVTLALGNMYIESDY